MQVSHSCDPGSTAQIFPNITIWKKKEKHFSHHDNYSNFPIDKYFQPIEASRKHF